MKRPDYKRAAKELMKILDEVEESKSVKVNEESMLNFQLSFST